MKNQVWLDIKGYEGIYQLSNLGNVRSLERISDEGKYYRQKEMKKTYNGNYEVVCLSKNGKSKIFYIERLKFQMFNNKKN